MRREYKPTERRVARSFPIRVKVMRWQARPFSVEVKRSKKIAGQEPNRAAQDWFAKVEVDGTPKPSAHLEQQNQREVVGLAQSVPETVKRILPDLTFVSVDEERRRQGRREETSKEVQPPKRRPRVAKPSTQPEAKAAPAELPAFTVAAAPVLAEPKRVPIQRRRRRRAVGLPPGARWKRRLPKLLW